MKRIILFLILCLSVKVYADDFWEKTSLSGHNINIIKFNPNGDIYAGVSGVGEMGLYISKDDGETWNRVSIDTGFTSVNNITFKGEKIYISSVNGLFISTDSGFTWELKDFKKMNVLNTIINDSDELLVCYGYCFTPSGGGVNCIYYIKSSSNDGYSWKDKKEYNGGEKISMVNYINNEILITDGTFNNGGQSYGYWMSIFTTNDFCNTIKPKASWRDRNGYYDDYNINYNNGDIIFTYKGKRQYFLWRAEQKKLDTMEIPLEIIGINYTLSLPNGLMFLASSSLDDGVFISNDSGNTWKEEYTGLNHETINYLAVNNQGILYAGTSDGVYRSKKPVLITDVQETTKPINDLSVQHNPLNRSLKIKYSLALPSEIKVRIFNLLGENLVSFNHSSGSGDNDFLIDNIDLKSGVYFVQLETSEWNVIKKVMVVE